MPLPGKAPGALRPGQKRPAGTQCPDRTQEEQRERREPSDKGGPRRRCKKGGPAGKSPPEMPKETTPRPGRRQRRLAGRPNGCGPAPVPENGRSAPGRRLECVSQQFLLVTALWGGRVLSAAGFGTVPEDGGLAKRGPGRQAFSLVYHSCETFLKGDYPQKYTHC